MKFWQKRVYADAAAATPLARGVLREMRRLEKHYANPGGLHAEAVAARGELEHARSRAAEAISAHADEILFTSGGTEANNLAIFGALRALLHEHGELNAITTPIEHPSVLGPLRALEREGLYITYLPVDGEGVVEPKALREALNDETVFVSVQMVNSEVGTIQNIREIAKEIRHKRSLRKTTPQESGKSSTKDFPTSGAGAPPYIPSKSFASRPETLPLYFHTDASQAPLWLTLNVEKLGIDLMTLDAQKMMGPKSSGLLYVRRGVVLEPLLFGGGQEGGLRSGTENVVLAGAIAQALVEAQGGVEKRTVSVANARDYLWGEVKKHFPNAVIHGAQGEGRVANNLNFSIPGLDGQMAVIALDARGVAASTRSACSTTDESSSHVLQALGVVDKKAKEAIRITLLPQASTHDSRVIVAALLKVADRYRNMIQ